MGTGKATAILSMKWEGVPVASTKHTMYVFNAVGGPSREVSSRLIRSLPHPDRTANVTDVRFTPKGTLFSAVYPSRVVQFWDPSSGKELRRIDSPREGRDRWRYGLLSADFGTLFVPIVGQKWVRNEDDPKQPVRMEFDSKVLVWDLATGKPKPTLKAHPGFGIAGADLSPDGSRLISKELAGGPLTAGVSACVVRMTDTAKGRSWKLADGNGTGAFSPDSKRAYIAVSGWGEKKEGGLLVFDREGKELPPLIRLGVQQCNSPTVSPDGKWLVASVSKGGKGDLDTLKVFDLATGKVVADIASKNNVYLFRATFSPDGRFMAVMDINCHVRVFDVTKWSVVLEHELKGMSWSGPLAFTKDGRRLAVPIEAKTDGDRSRDPDPLDYPQPRIYLFDLTKAKSAPEEIVCPHGWARSLAFSADGKMLAIGSTGAVHLFDVSGPAK